MTCPEKACCTDPAADNYDPTCVIDDGSCTYTCPGISLSCDSTSASKNKCGFSFGGKRYLSQILTILAIGGGGGHTDTYECRNSTDVAHIVPNDSSYNFEVFFTHASNYIDVACSAISEECHQGGFVSQSNSAASDCGDEECTVSGSVIDTGSCSFPPSIPPLPILQISCDLFTCSVEFPPDSVGPCGFVNVWSQASPPESISYDNEFTTAMLIAYTESSLPPFAPGSCVASRYLSSDENTYSISRARPKFTYTPVGFDFQICYNEHTVFAGGGSTDHAVCLFAAAGSSETDGPQLNEPSDNGSVTITDVHCVT
jgi:hypothetical protein